MATTKPPAPRVVPPDPKVNPTVPTVTAEASGSSEGSYKSYHRRISTALANLSLGVPTQARCILDGYFRFLGKSMVHVDFPRTLRVQPNNPEASAEGAGSKYLLLYFHVGNAVKTYQQLGYSLRSWAGIAITPAGETAVKAEFAALEARTAHLEMLARTKLADLHITGSDAQGWRLERAGT